MYPVVALAVQEPACDKMTLNYTHTIAMPPSSYGTIVELYKYTINGENWVKGRWDFAASCRSIIVSQ